ncbi:MAG: glycosyltransferase, partial [Litoreibacter sp.]
MLILALICLAAMAVPFTIYPLMLWLHARLAADTALKADMFPHVDLIICAHNEADHIAAKMQNVEALNYPKDKLSVWVASDGSSDATVEIASASAADNVTVLDLPRTGKAGA